MSDLGQPIISVANVSKSFRLPHERYTGLKQAIFNFRFGKKFEVQHVLTDITFDIKRGEFFGIVGRNGSGKSTLLKLLAQIYVPNSGSVHVNGSLTPFIELGVGFNPELTGRENVYMNGALLGFDRKQTNGMYDKIVDFAELREFMDQKLKNYSSGMQVRLAFSIAIRAQSDILLIDEVLAVGDAAFQQKCFSYFEEMKREHRTMVLVTHDMSAVNRFCNRALILENGSIKKIGAPSDVSDVYREDNMESASKAANADASLAHLTSKLQLEVTSRSENGLNLRLTFDSDSKEKLFIGIAVASNGVSIAEASTIKELELRGGGKVTYFLETTNLNAGAYNLSAALLTVKDRQLIGVSKNRSFVIKGNDDSKGGSLRLPGGWVREG